MAKSTSRIPLTCGEYLTKGSDDEDDETIRDIAGHVSKQMLKHYSHIRMEAKRTALESIVKKSSPAVKSEANEAPSSITEPVSDPHPTKCGVLPVQ